MKILFVTEATGWSGGANQICLTAGELRRRGHEVAAACRPWGELRERLKGMGVPVYDFRIFQDYDLPSAWRLARFARDFGARLLHAHHPKAHAMGVLASHLGLRLPLVVTRRVVNPIGTNPLSRLKYRSRRVTRYVAVCRAAAEELVRAGVERGRIAVIPSAVELPRFEAAAAARDSLRTLRPKVITMVGNLSPIKGHRVLLEAAARVLAREPETEFRVAGRDTERLADDVARLGLDGKVRLLGYRSDIPELLARTHLYAMPSLMEGIGTALIEAQAARVPVVGSSVGGLPDVVEPGITGTLVPPGDPAALAEAITGLLRDPDRAEEMARRGYERVKERYSLKTVADRLESLYRELAA